MFVRRTPLGGLGGLHLPQWSWVVRILRIALPAALQATLRVLSLTAFTVILAMVPGGSTAIGAMSTAFGIESVMIMPSFGLAVSAGALVGQSLGMGRPERAERLGWVAANHGALVTLALAVPTFLFAPGIASVMLGDKPDMIGEAVTLIRYLSATEMLFSYAMVVIGAMQGAGDTVRPMWVTICSLWGIRVPLAIALALPVGFPLFAGLKMPIGWGLGANGAWVSMAITQGIQGIIAPLLFKQGAWKTKKV
jgi:Na+-driven multidrug efflux pump